MEVAQHSKGVGGPIAATPYYVLMDGTHRIGPKVTPSLGGTACEAIYGFSDKGTYDTYCMNCQLALTPYPLVKAYLRDEATLPGVGLRLVVLDASGLDPCLRAATTEAVLQAQEERMTHVAAAYRLVFDRDTDAYRVEAAFA